MSIVGFTGTRKGMSPHQKWVLSQYLAPDDEFHHGDCVGADAEAHDMAARLGCRIVIHPCTLRAQRAFKKGDTVFPPLPPLERNKIIVDQCEVLCAAPATDEEELRSGTWATIRYARRIGRQVIMLKREDAASC